MAAHFAEPILAFLGVDAILGVLPRDAVPLHEALDSDFLGSADRHGGVAKLRQAAFEECDGVNGGKPGIFRQSANNFRPDGPVGDGVQVRKGVCIVKDDEALQTAKDLAKKEGILCGISSGTNVAAAIRLAKKLGKGKRVVTVLPDTAERYFSTPLFEK